MNTVLEVKNLKKVFGKKQVLNDVSFTLNEGEILGFIGPNGAGKTTTIKLILGLQTITEGEVYINGFSIEKDFEKAILKVGAIVESPDLYMYLSGRKNLEMIARMYKDVSKDKIDEVIKLSGLDKRINDKVSKYSLGMRQRLGIAAALLNSPNLLILDEPTNGLDPEGIKELRELLNKIAKENKTAILISSHNLLELESFISNVCIIQNGNIITTGKIEEIKEYSKPHFKLEVNDISLIKDMFEFKTIKDNEIEIMASKEEIPNIVKKLVEKGIDIYKVEPSSMSLEEAFFNKTGGNNID